jgi:hypothetical protein
MTATTAPRTNSRKVAVEDLPQATKVGEVNIGVFRWGAKAHRFNKWIFEGLDSGTFINTDQGVKRICWKCDGTGCLPEHMGVFDGVCFACNGIGTSSLFAKDMEAARRKAYTTIKRQEREAAKRAAQAEADRLARETEFKTWLAANKAFVVTLAKFIKSNKLTKTITKSNGYTVDAPGDDITLIEFAEDVMAKRTLTDKQVKFVSDLMERVAARKAEAEATRYAAPEGTRFTFTGKVTHSINLEPKDVGYGHVSYQHMVVLAGTGEWAGCFFKWIGSANLAWELEVDTEYKLTGTVKKHDIYNDTKQTILTRCKLAA